ncbi:MAG: head GIN domain-containing protein [Ginsengibacter sp.]
MTKYLIFILAAFIFCSCDHMDGSGNIKTEKRNVSRFNGVQGSGSMDIEVSNGDKFSVEVEADDNILEYVITEVDDDMLDIHFKQRMSFNNVHAKVYVTAPGLKRLFIRGSGNISSKNTIKNTESLTTKISGSGNINADVDAPRIKADISGSGNLSLQGRCKSFEGSISGSGDLKCKNLLSENATVSIFGSGTAHVFASVHLKASTTGSGDIYYSGNPSSPETSKTGSGSIQAENR